VGLDLGDVDRQRTRHYSILKYMRDEWLDELESRLAPNESVAGLPQDLRRAAVLAVIYERDGQPVIPLIERTRGRGVHSGQLALPGGGAEPADRTLLETALREAEEEISIDTRELRVLGHLPPVQVRVSGFVVIPFVAWAETPPMLVPNDAEVASIVHLALSVVADPSLAREIPNPPGSTHPVMYEYPLPEGRLWGATARMIHNLGTVLPPL